MDDYLSDGSVLDDGLVLHQRRTDPRKGAGFIPFPVRAQVTQVFEIDDDNNRDGDTIYCDVRVTNWGIDLFKVPFLLDKADYDNYISFKPRAATKNFDPEMPFDQIRIDPEFHDGTTVLVQFLEGSIHQPIITKVFPHHLSGRTATDPDNVPGSSPSPRPVKADGDSFKFRFNGTNVIVDKAGNIKIETTNTVDEDILKKKKITIELNEKDEEGVPKKQKVEFVLDNSLEGQSVLRVTGEDEKVQAVVLDHATQSIALTNQHDDGENKILMNALGISIDTPKLVKIVAGENTDIQVIGTAVVNSTGKMTVSSDADVDVIAGGACKVESTGGNTTVKASGDVNVDAGGDVDIKSANNAINGQVVTDNPINNDPITGLPLTGAGGTKTS